jgi:hypothetical protein
MALDSTYSGLKASIADWLMRGDLTAAIPDFIAMAEADMSRRLAAEDDNGAPPREMIAYAQSPISQEFETTPADFMGARAAFLDGATAPLDYTTVEDIARRKALYPSSTGNPTAYTALGAMFQFWPAPAAEIQINLFYVQRIASLNGSITTNWLLTQHPDCYLFASLMQSAPYLKNDDRVAVWQSRYDRTIASIRLAGRRAQMGSYLSIPTPSVVV